MNSYQQSGFPTWSIQLEIVQNPAKTTGLKENIDISITDELSTFKFLTGLTILMDNLLFSSEERTRFLLMDAQAAARRMSSFGKKDRVEVVRDRLLRK